MIIYIPDTEEVKRLGNRLWILIKPFEFYIDDQQYTIPKGFVTDGASCPRVLWNICPPMGSAYGQGAIIHDWLYSCGKGIPSFSRNKTDSIFYHTSRYRGAGLIKSALVWSAVRVFGKQFYKQENDNKVSSKSCYDLSKAIKIISKLTME